MRDRPPRSFAPARLRRLSALLGIAFVFGCTGELDPASLLNKTRPLGLRVEASTDPTRSTIAPGETASMTLLMGHAAEEVPVSYVAVLCVPAATRLGAGFCATDENGQPVLIGGIRAGGDVVGDPSFDFDIPDAATLDSLGATDELVFFGAVCDGPLALLGADLADPSGLETANPCREPENSGALLTGSVTLDRGVAPPNHHPAFMVATIAGATWTAEPGSADGLDGCDSEPIPQISLGEPVEIELRATATSRETYTVESETEGTLEVREELQITTLATGGEMQRTFSFLDDDRDVAFVEWLPGREGRDTPTRVRFEFVMRDGRGGITRWRRQACAVD